MLQAIGQLNGVGGNHARSYFEMAPASLVVRLTPQLVAGYNTYGFTVNEDGKHTFSEVIEGILQGDYPAEQFWLGGNIVKDMEESLLDALGEKGVHLKRNAQGLLDAVGEVMFSEEVLC